MKSIGEIIERSVKLIVANNFCNFSKRNSRVDELSNTSLRSLKKESYFRFNIWATYDKKK